MERADAITRSVVWPRDRPNAERRIHSMTSPTRPGLTTRNKLFVRLRKMTRDKVVWNLLRQVMFRSRDIMDRV